MNDNIGKNIPQWSVVVHWMIQKESSL